MNQDINPEIIEETEELTEELAEAAEERAEEIAEAAEEKAEEIAEAAEEARPAKKKSKAGKVIGIIAIVLVALILLAVIAVGAIGLSVFNKATAEVQLPVEEKVSSSDMTLFVASACIDLLAKKPITVDNGEMQALVDKVKPSLESALAGTPVELKDLFCVFAEDKGTIYGLAHIGEVEVSGIKLNINKDVTIAAEFDVNFEEPNIVAQIKSLKCGELDIPVSLITQFAGNFQLPEGLKLEGDELTYDVSGLDAMIDEMLPEIMKENLGDGFIVSALTDHLVSSTNAEITGADIIDNELVIQAQLF